MENINIKVKKVKKCVICDKDESETKFQQYMKRCMSCNNKQFRNTNIDYHRINMQKRYVKVLNPKKRGRKPKIDEIKPTITTIETIENINIEECKLCGWMCEYPQCHKEYSKGNCEYIKIKKYDISYDEHGEIFFNLKNI